jgi:phosphopantothenoylcysteine decarboxylase
MANVLLGVTGSVAAIYTPELFAELRGAGHTVKVVATRAALHFFDPKRFAYVGEVRDRNILTLDEDEWPDSGYRRGDPVLHIELRRWADVLLVAPLDANSLAKFALGVADNCLTCVYRAWDRTRPVIVAPAMNTLMWEHPVTTRQLQQVGADVGERFVVLAPQTKKLACDDVGLGAMASRPDIMATLELALRKPDSV